MKILFAVIKYSSQGYQTVQEYPISNLNEFSFGIGMMNLCVILLVILLILTTIYNATSCDIRQPLNQDITLAKSSARINQIASNIYLCILLMYFYIGYDHYQTYIFIIIILYGIITGYYIYYIPFYS